MADDRIYLHCKICKRVLFLGKRYIGGYYWENYGKQNNMMFDFDPLWKPQDERHLEDRLNEFYDTHSYCALGTTEDEWAENIFDIVYETDEGFNEKVNFGGG